MPQPLPPVPATATLTYMRSKVSEADAMFRQGLGNLSQPSDMIRLASRLLDLCNDVSDHLNHLCIVKPVACRNGCDTCCRSLIQVNPIFAHLALDHAQRTFTPDRLEQLHQRLLTGVPFCPFLFDGVCSIYEQRPMVCRGYYSLDVALCLAGTFCEDNPAYQGDDGHAAHHYRIFLFVLEKRLEEIEKEFGIAPEPVFLHEAVHLLWDDWQASVHHPDNMSASSL